jgi:hypothetical protein
MIDWLVNWIVAAGAWVSGLFVSKDAPNFAVVSGMTAIVLVVAFVFFLFVCSARRSRKAGDQ